MERPVPAAPELVAPVQGAPVRGDAARLVWQGVENATAYHVQVGVDEAFRTLMVDTRLDAGTTAVVVQHLLHGGEGTVFWRVAAVGVGGQGAYSETGEFFASSAPAEAPYAGLTAEAGAETGVHGADRGPAQARHFASGRADFSILVAAMVLSVIIVGVAFIAFPGLAGEERQQIADRDSVSDALQVQQQLMEEQLYRFSADSTGYTIPIDTVIARMAQSADTGSTRMLF